MKGEGRMSKKKWIIVASAIIIIVAGAIGGYIWYQNDQRQKILDSIQRLQIRQWWNMEVILKQRILLINKVED